MNIQKWDKRFLAMASLVATWSKDPKRQVGCVIVDENRRVVATGYNGLPTQLDSIKNVSNELKNALTIHAEVNCISNIRGELDAHSLGPVTVYVTYPPCEHCAKMLTSNLNVKRVVFRSHEASQSKWKDSMACALHHLETVGAGFDEYNRRDLEETD